MIPIRDSAYSKKPPVMTVTLSVLMVAIYLWDRGGNLFGPSLLLGDLALRPQAVLQAALGQSDPVALVTLFTALFLHGNLAHIIGNLLFLGVFGDNIEAVLGPVRFTLYYLMWGVAASLTHIFMQPGSNVPMLGASGAIGGVLGAYFLLFPGNQIRFYIFPVFFYIFTISAWIMLGIWFLAQIVLPQPGVANWAHAGGFLAGMLTVLLIGGREVALKDVEFEHEPDQEA